MAAPSAGGTWDVIVVGAGPAGSAAALAALRDRPDARVLILDRSPIGRDKICGDALSPTSSVELGKLGVTATLDSELVPTVRLVSPSGLSHPVDSDPPGHVVPRQILDRRLIMAAVHRGAEFRQVRVTSLEQDSSGVTVNENLRAPIVIGADGSNSVVRHLLKEPANRGAALAIAIRGYAPTPAGHPFELSLRWDSQRAGGLCYAWAFPTANGTTNVGYGMSSAALSGGRAVLEQRMRAMLPDFDLDGVPVAGHTLPLTLARPRPAVGRVLLTGDAASLINPITGEGIYSALASGAMAGAAAVADPATAGRAYAGALGRRFGKQFRQLKLVYPMIDRSIVLDTAIRAGSRDARLLQPLLSFALSDGTLSLTDVLRIGRHVGRRS
jgi:geranylgeranyl reductase family protein